MVYVSQHKAHHPNAKGIINYSDEENQIWQTLYEGQQNILSNRACDAYLKGLELIKFNKKAIPQLLEVNQRLSILTGWKVVPVKSFISPNKFFRLLASRCFPVATFIRSRAELRYGYEPDIFHELFGHCPLLTNKAFADFMQKYAALVCSFKTQYWPLLQRIFWFTVEFGLIESKNGLRVYGGGILSSMDETVHSIESDLSIRAFFDFLVALRTPYRMDTYQAIYFVIHDFNQLYQILELNIPDLIVRARELGEYPPLFPLDNSSQDIHINVL